MPRQAARLLFLLLVIATIAIGCRKTPPPATAGGPQVVPVSHPVQRPVTEYVEYTGRADAVDSIGIKARATGYLIQAPFIEGAEIKKGNLLFEVDPKPYQAQLAQAEAQVGVAEAQLVLAKASYARVRNVSGSVAVSPQVLDQAQSVADASDDQVKAPKSTAPTCRLSTRYHK